MVPYAAAGPDCAIVLPSRIESLVIPMSVCGVGVAEPPQAARVTKKTASAANRGAFGPIEIPPALMNSYLNSLGVRRHLSSLPITRPAQPPVQRGVAGIDQSDDPVPGEHHDRNQHHAVGDRRSRVLDIGRDLDFDPGLARQPLVRLDRQEIPEYCTLHWSLD